MKTTTITTTNGTRVWLDADGRAFGPDADGTLPGLLLGRVSRREGSGWHALPARDDGSYWVTPCHRPSRLKALDYLLAVKPAWMRSDLKTASAQGQS